MRKYLFLAIFFTGLLMAAPAQAALSCATLPKDATPQEVESKWIHVAVGIPGVTVPCKDSSGVTREYIQDMGAYIAGLYKFFAGAIGIIATTMVFYGGIKWVSAAGNPSKIKDAKETIFSALIAVVIALGSYLLLYTINPRLVNLRPPALTVVNAIFQRFDNLCPTTKFCLSGTDEGKKCTQDSDCAGQGPGVCGYPFTLEQGQKVPPECGTVYTYRAVKGVANAGERCLGSSCTGDGLCRKSNAIAEPPVEGDAKCIGASGACTSQKSGCEQWSLPNLGVCKSWTYKVDGDGQTATECRWYPILKCPPDYTEVGCGECQEANAVCPAIGVIPAACQVTATSTQKYKGLVDGDVLQAICCKQNGLQALVCKT